MRFGTIVIALFKIGETIVSKQCLPGRLETCAIERRIKIYAINKIVTVIICFRFNKITQGPFARNLPNICNALVEVSRHTKARG